MEMTEFEALVGKDICVEYDFNGEKQIWSMKNFYIDENGIIHHNRLPLIIDVFVKNASNPHCGTPTHG
ncbi:MAG: hypothetical protein IJT36_03230 [Alphaproteobacteria bacterium]|nr:hypothetical protein [Alphaproteobacteria bacterium]